MVYPHAGHETWYTTLYAPSVRYNVLCPKYTMFYATETPRYILVVRRHMCQFCAYKMGITYPARRPLSLPAPFFPSLGIFLFNGT